MLKLHLFVTVVWKGRSAGLASVARVDKVGAEKFLPEEDEMPPRQTVPQQEEDERPPRQTVPQQEVPVRELGDWFVLLDVVPREVTYKAPGTITIY